MTVSGTVRTIGASTSGVAGAVVGGRNLDTGVVDGEATTDMNGTYAVGGLPGNRYSIEVTPPSGFLAAAPIHVARPESGDPEVTVDFSLLRYLTVSGTVRDKRGGGFRGRGAPSCGPGILTPGLWTAKPRQT